jgi:flagellar protein FliJ
MFRFRLQRVLDLRADAEQQAATALTQAQVRLQQANTQKETLETALEAGYARLSAAGVATRTVGQMLQQCYVLDQIDARLARADADIRAAEDETRTRQDALSVAFRDRRVLDRLREKRLEEFRVEETKAELTAMDGLALSRFVTRRATPPREGTK